MGAGWINAFDSSSGEVERILVVEAHYHGGSRLWAAPVARNDYCRCPFPTRDSIRKDRCNRCRGGIR